MFFGQLTCQIWFFLDQSDKDVVECLGLPHESLEHDCFSIDFFPPTKMAINDTSVADLMIDWYKANIYSSNKSKTGGGTSDTL